MIKFISRATELWGVTKADDIISTATMKDVCAWLDDHLVFGVDTETTGHMNHENKVIMLQLGDEHNQFVIDTRSIDVRCLRKYFEDPTWLKIFHNAKFDINFLRFTFEWRVEGVYCTFLAECCLTNGIEGRSLGLAALTAKYCRGAMLDKTERGRFIGMGSKPYTHSNIIYGARDVEYLPCILQKQEVEASNRGLTEVVELECKVVLALADIEYNGMILDVDRWLALARTAATKMKELEGELDAMVMDHPKLQKFRKKFVQQDMFGGYEKPIDIKWTSPIQVLKVLQTLGVTEDSTSEKEILKYQNKIPLVKKFLDYKHEQKLTTTYGQDFLGYINKRTGRIHTSFWQVLDTHRVSSSEPNLQQIPARKEYLACFTAPSGCKIVGADFSGQELRLIAEGSQDPLWLDAFNNGRDLHGELAALIFNIPLSDVKEKPEYVYVGETKVYLRGTSPRDVTKKINFMLAYGGGKKKLSDMLGIGEFEADLIIQRYYDLVPKVKTFLDRCAAYGVKHGYIRSYKPYSILRQFHNMDTRDQKVRGEIERASKNTPIQGTGAMMCKLALVKLREKIKEVFPYNVEMFLQVHDAIFCYVEEDYAQEWGKIQKEIMEKCGRVWLKSIPCISDVSITDHWSK